MTDSHRLLKLHKLPCFYYTNASKITFRRDSNPLYRFSKYLIRWDRRAPINTTKCQLPR